MLRISVPVNPGEIHPSSYDPCGPGGVGGEM